jgi:putative DNA primase/helicase
MDYSYKNKGGNVVGYVRRTDVKCESDNSKSNKQIVPYFTPDTEGGFTSGIPNSLKGNMPLYGLDSISDKHQPIYIVEGEKCAMALHGLGLQAVTSQGRALNSHNSDWSTLSEASQVYLLPDNDEQGMKYVENVYRALKSLSLPPVNMNLVKLPYLAPKGDVCDWLSVLDGMADWDGLQSLKEYPTPPEMKSIFLKEVDDHSDDVPIRWKYIISTGGVNAIDIDNFQKMDFPEMKNLLSPWLQNPAVCMVFAERGLGKTFFSLSVAIAVANGDKFLRYEAPEPQPVLYLDGEMQGRLMQERINMLTGGVPTKAPFYIVTPDCQNENGVPDLATTEGRKDVKELIDELKPKLIVIDNLSTFLRSSTENDGEDWVPLQEFANHLRTTGHTILFVHHTNKEGTQRGTSRKEDTMDTIVHLKPTGADPGEYDGACFEINFTKHRNIKGEEIMPIVAYLEPNGDKVKWNWNFADYHVQNVVNMFKDGVKQKDIATELNISEAKVCRLLKTARSTNMLS